MNALTKIDPIVHTEGNRVYATSKDVAAYFGKEHRNVLADIGSLIEAAASIELNFQRIEIPVRVGFGTRMDRAYQMDRDGFLLLAMGFTGQKALEFGIPIVQGIWPCLTLTQVREGYQVPLQAAPRSK